MLSICRAFGWCVPRDEDAGGVQATEDARTPLLQNEAAPASAAKAAHAQETRPEPQPVSSGEPAGNAADRTLESHSPEREIVPEDASPVKPVQKPDEAVEQQPEDPVEQQPEEPVEQQFVEAFEQQQPAEQKQEEEEEEHDTAVDVADDKENTYSAASQDQPASPQAPAVTESSGAERSPPTSPSANNVTAVPVAVDDITPTPTRNMQQSAPSPPPSPGIQIDEQDLHKAAKEVAAMAVANDSRNASSGQEQSSQSGEGSANTSTPAPNSAPPISKSKKKRTKRKAKKAAAKAT